MCGACWVEVGCGAVTRQTHEIAVCGVAVCGRGMLVDVHVGFPGLDYLQVCRLG